MGTHQSRKTILRKYLSVFVLSVITVFLCSVNSTVLGQDSTAILADSTHIEKTQPWDKFSVNIGGFFAGYNSAVVIGSANVGLGLMIDAERLLGLQTSTWGLKGNAQIRVGKKNRGQVSLWYLGVNRTATKTLEKDLAIGDTIFVFNSEITTRFYLSMFRLKYGYSFYQDDRVSLGASIGLYILPVKFSVAIEGNKGTSTDFLAPLPVVGLNSDILITKKFYFHQTVDFLYIAAGGFTGSILDLDFSCEYRPIKFLGIGIGINSTKWQLTSDGSSYPGVNFYGNIGLSYTGFYMFGKYIL